MSTVIDQRNHRNLCYRLAPSTSNGGLETAPWGAVYLRPRYEAVSARYLTEKGHEVGGDVALVGLTELVMEKSTAEFVERFDRWKS
jgi:hypothetical protein